MDNAPDRNLFMQNIAFLLLRRMRMPMSVLICAYAVSVLGFVLIPGADNAGRPWHMDFFHAFYLVSFTGSTIGFGEIPYPFTDPQRMWATFTIYLTVIAWLYGIGSILAVIQDPAFKRAVAGSAFARSVRRMREPFYLVCGYGDTGSLLVQMLTDRGIRSVVIDIAQDRIDVLDIGGLALHVPGLCADAADPASLLTAGLEHPYCAGVVAVTNQDQVNLKVAITSKLLNASLPVICRAESHDSAANMASFGTDHIINPFDTFADRFAMAIHSPAMHLIYEWMTSTRHTPLIESIAPPRGTWILCGYGRFGKALERYLAFEGLRTTVIEADPERTQPPPDSVHGRGTEAVTLREAKIEQAVGIVAGTDNDANNLSIVVTALQLNPQLFIVIRQNQRSNDPVFHAARANLVMQRGSIIARKIAALLQTPLLTEFLRHARHKDEAWAQELVEEIRGIAGNTAPDTWGLNISASSAPAVARALAEGQVVTLRHIRQDPRDRDILLPALPLLLKRGESEILLPPGDTLLETGDRILFCGRPEAASRMQWTLNNLNALEYIITGIDRPSGYLWRRLAGERG